MNCKIVSEFIAPYINLELSDETHAQINTHLEECPNCRIEYQAQLEVHRLLSEKLERSEVHSGLKEKIMKKAIGSPEHSLWVFRKVNIPIRPITGFAVAAVLLFGVFLSGPIIEILYSDNLLGLKSTTPVSTPQLTDGVSVSVVGKIVCIGCYLSRNYKAKHDCKIHGHCYGILTDDGSLWTFTVNKVSEELKAREGITGKDIQIGGQLFYSAHFIDINNYKLVSNEN